MNWKLLVLFLSSFIIIATPIYGSGDVAIVLFMSIILLFLLLKQNDPILFIAVSISYLFKLILLFIDLSLYDLPFTGDDTLRFKILANLYYEYIYYGNDFIPFQSSTFYPKLVSIIYLLFGSSDFVIGYVNVIINIFTGLLTYKIVLFITQSTKRSRYASVIFLFYPTITIFSVIPLRESFIVFFLSIFVLLSLKFLNQPKIYLLFFIIVFSVVLINLHSGMIGVVITFVLFYIYKFISKKSYIKVILLSISLLLLMFILLTIGINKLPSIDNIFDSYAFQRDQIMYSPANYLTFLSIDNFLELFIYIPLLIIYFYLTPFIWEVNSIGTLIASVDGLFIWMLFSYLIIKTFSKRAIYKNKYLLFLIILILTETIIFSIGTVNYGTGIRHRAKIIYLLLIFFFLTYSKSGEWKE